MNKNEINARIAEYVLKTANPRMTEHPSYDFNRWYHYNVERGRLKDYTEWENVKPVLDWLRVEFGSIEVGTIGEEEWWVNLPEEIGDGYTTWKIITTEETLPLAICIASLKVVGQWEESLA